MNSVEYVDNDDDGITKERTGKVTYFTHSKLFSHNRGDIFLTSQSLQYLSLSQCSNTGSDRGHSWCAYRHRCFLFV